MYGQFPGLAYRGTDGARRPWLVGSGMDVWEPMMLLRAWDDHDALLRDTALPAEDVDLDAIATAHPTITRLRLDD